MLLMVSCGLFGQEKDIDLIEFIKEIQLTKKVGSNMKMVWWIPTEYWEISTKGSPYVTEEGLRDLEEIVDSFTIIAALDGNIAPGTIDYKDTLKVNLALGSQLLSPLRTEEIPKDVKNVLRTLKPVFVNMIGEMGKNFNFYVFPNAGEDGNKLIAPKQKGEFSFTLNGELFDWLLPLESFVPTKKCPIDDKSMSGTWEYCPWHGVKLVE